MYLPLSTAMLKVIDKVYICIQDLIMGAVDKVYICIQDWIMGAVDVHLLPVKIHLSFLRLKIQTNKIQHSKKSAQTRSKKRKQRVDRHVLFSQ